MGCLMNASVSISRSNSKLGAAIPSFSLPPVVTCRPAAPCIRDCYACKMCRLRSSVGAAWARNLEIWKSSPDAVRYAILSEALMSSYFRYFVGGDIPDPAFFQLMVDVANAAPRCEFLAFTKKFEIVNAFLDAGGIIPANLRVIFSEWRDDLRAENPHNLPLSRVVYHADELPERAKVCGGNCADCICRGVACWELKPGEVIHFFKH